MDTFTIWFFVLAASFVVLLITVKILAVTGNKKIIGKKLAYLDQMRSEILIGEDNWNQLRNGIVNKTMSIAQFDSDLQRCVDYNRRMQYLESKYGFEIASRIYTHNYWIGMTQEQLLDCKGKPDRIETEQLKTKKKETFIYGYKSSGDYFVFENGIAVKIVDR
jgi:hypothetical protein